MMSPELMDSIKEVTKDNDVEDDGTNEPCDASFCFFFCVLKVVFNLELIKRFKNVLELRRLFLFRHFKKTVFNYRNYN